MENFVISCHINNELSELSVFVKQTSVRCFYIYSQGYWLATISCLNKNFQISSYSNRMRTNDANELINRIILSMTNSTAVASSGE
jgi:hypothetical protein